MSINRAAAIAAICSHLSLPYSAVAEALEGVLDEDRWIPCKERLPFQDSDAQGRSEECIVSAYSVTECPTKRREEILTGRFYRSQTELWFESDRITLFLPDEWDVITLDEKFEMHLDRDDCTFYDLEGNEIFEDQYYGITAWQPMPKYYP